MMMICQDKCVVYILDLTNYYVPFITVLLTLIWNYLEASVHHFTVARYGLHTENQHLISYVWL